MTGVRITTSWDDGAAQDLRLAELLSRHRLRGTFYIPRTGPTGTLSPAEIRELAQSHEVGAHTLDHVDLWTVSDDAARQQIQGSKAWIEDVTGRPCRMFCPPLGHFRRRQLAMVREAGFAGLRTVELLSIGRPRRRDGLAVMPTTVQAFPHSAGGYIRNALRRLSPGALLRYAVHGRGRNWTQVAASLLDLAQRRGGVFHLWGHSWEIEATEQWVALDQVLRMLGEAAQHIPTATNGDICRAATAA